MKTLKTNLKQTQSGMINSKDGSEYMVFLGASITAAYGLPSEYSFPSQIQKSLNEIGKNIKVINASSSGSQTTSSYRQISPYLTAKYNVKYVITAMGLSDFVMGVNREEIKGRLRQSYEEIWKYDDSIKIYQIHNEVFQDTYLKNVTPKQKSDYKSIFSELAKETNIILLPFFLKGVAKKPELNLADGIHPNKEGMKIVSENVWNPLKNYI